LLQPSWILFLSESLKKKRVTYCNILWCQLNSDIIWQVKFYTPGFAGLFAVRFIFNKRKVKRGTCTQSQGQQYRFSVFGGEENMSGYNKVICTNIFMVMINWNLWGNYKMHSTLAAKATEFKEAKNWTQTI